MNTKKKALVFAVLALLLLNLSVASVSACPPCPGTVTPGYLKNHPEVWDEKPDAWSAWSELQEYFGLQDYTPGDVMEWLWQPTRGDKTYTLFRAAFAAKFNVVNGCWCEEVNCPLSEALWWLVRPGGYPVGSGVKASSDAWKEAEPLYLELDAYNNGELCAPARD